MIGVRAFESVAKRVEKGYFQGERKWEIFEGIHRRKVCGYNLEKYLEGVDGCIFRKLGSAWDRDFSDGFIPAASPFFH